MHSVTPTPSVDCGSTPEPQTLRCGVNRRRHTARGAQSFTLLRHQRQWIVVLHPNRNSQESLSPCGVNYGIELARGREPEPLYTASEVLGCFLFNWVNGSNAKPMTPTCVESSKKCSLTSSRECQNRQWIVVPRLNRNPQTLPCGVDDLIQRALGRHLELVEGGEHRGGHPPLRDWYFMSYLAPCQPLLRAFSGWIRSPPPTPTPDTHHCHRLSRVA